MQCLLSSCLSFRNLLNPAARELPTGRSVEELFTLLTVPTSFRAGCCQTDLDSPLGALIPCRLPSEHPHHCDTNPMVVQRLFPCLVVKKCIALIVACFVHFLLPFLPEPFLAVVNTHGTELPEAIPSTSVEIHVTSCRTVTSA